MTEQEIQRAVFKHLAARGAPHVFAFHVPNGGFRRRREAAIFKGLGVVAGVPDILLVRAGHLYALELKRPGGKVSETQKTVHERLRLAGVEVHTAFSLNAALEWLERFSFLRGRT